MDFFSFTSYDLLDVARPNLRDFFINAFQDLCETDILDNVLDKMNDDTDLDDLHAIPMVVIKRLLELCASLPQQKHKVDVCNLLFHFMLYYPGVFDWVYARPRFMDTVIDKLVELAGKHRRGVMTKGERPFLKDETRDMANALRAKGHVGRAEKLEVLLE